MVILVVVIQSIIWLLIAGSFTRLAWQYIVHLNTDGHLLLKTRCLAFSIWRWVSLLVSCCCASDWGRNTRVILDHSTILLISVALLVFLLVQVVILIRIWLPSMMITFDVRFCLVYLGLKVNIEHVSSLRVQLGSTAELVDSLNNISIEYLLRWFIIGINVTIVVQAL